MNNFNPVLGDNQLPEYISVISASRCARIHIEDIEVIEQEGRKLHVIAADKEYCFYESMKDIIMCLYGRAFYRPVKGLIINFNHVKEISGNAVTFHSGHVVTMGKNSITRTRASYKKYLMRFPPYSLVDINPSSMQVAENALLREPAPEKKRKYATSEKKLGLQMVLEGGCNQSEASSSDNTKDKAPGDSADEEAGDTQDKAPGSSADDALICKPIEPKHIQHAGKRCSYEQAAGEAKLLAIKSAKPHTTQRASPPAIKSAKPHTTQRASPPTIKGD